MGDLAAQQQAMGARHQHHFYFHSGTGGNLCGLGEFDASFGDDHRQRLADLAKQGLPNHRAEQVEALVLCPQERGERTVLVA